MKTVLLLDWSHEWREYMMTELEKMNIRVLIVIDQERHIPDYVEKTMMFSTLYDHPEQNADRIINYFSDYTIDAVLSTEDELVELSCIICDTLKLPSASPTSVRNAMDKYKTREIMNSNNLENMKYKLAKSYNDLADIENEIGFPLVLKPICSSFSSGVSIVNSSDDLFSAWKKAVKNSEHNPFSNSDVLVEEYLDDIGRVITMEVAVFNGEYIPLISIEECQYFEKDEDDVNIYYDKVLLPSRITSSEMTQLREYAGKIISAIGFKHGIAHLEFKMTKFGFRLLEINPRLIGGYVPEICEYITGVNLAAVAIELALGHRPNVNMKIDKCGCLKFYDPKESGIITRINGLEAALEVPGIDRIKITVNEGDTFIKGDTYGVAMIMTSGTTYNTAIKSAISAESKLNISIQSNAVIS